MLQQSLGLVGLQMSGNIQRSLGGSVPIEAERRGRTRRPLRANSSGVVEIRSPLSRSTGRCQCPSLIKYWRSWKEGSSRRWVNINGSLVFLACRKRTRVWSRLTAAVRRMDPLEREACECERRTLACCVAIYRCELLESVCLKSLSYMDHVDFWLFLQERPSYIILLQSSLTLMGFLASFCG